MIVTFPLLPKGYIKETSLISRKDALQTYKLGYEKLDGTLMFASSSLTIPIPPFKVKILDNASLQYLEAIYHFLYPGKNIDVLHFYDCYSRMTLAGDLIGSVHNNSSSSVIMASWPKDET